MIDALDTPPYELIQASLSLKRVDDILGALRALPGDVDYRHARGLLFAHMRRTLQSDRSAAQHIARTLFHMAMRDDAPSPAALAQMYLLDDAFDLALGGIRGDPADVFNALVGFLDAYSAQDPL